MATAASCAVENVRPGEIVELIDSFGGMSLSSVCSRLKCERK